MGISSFREGESTIRRCAGGDLDRSEHIERFRVRLDSSCSRFGYVRESTVDVSR
jgi:hypothetical protein